MTDLDRAISGLKGHTICLAKGADLLVSDKRGIMPMMELLAAEKDLKGYSVADLVVGKAAAILFIKAGVAAVYAKTMSRSAEDILRRYGIPYTRENSAERIRNRQGTGYCPMESAVLDCEDIEEGYRLLAAKIAETTGA